MKWFKHYGNAHSNQFLQALLREKNGLALYAQWFLLLEFLCMDFKKDSTEFHASSAQLKAVLQVGQDKKLLKVLETFSELSAKFDRSLLEVSETSDKVFKIKTPIILELMGKDFKRTRARGVTATAKKENKNKKEKKEKKESLSPVFSEVVDYLNLKADKNYRPSSKETQGHIKARLSDGFTVKDFKTVIDRKVEEWKGSQKMDSFLRPKTLFSTNFESYLNQIDKTVDPLEELFLNATNNK